MEHQTTGRVGLGRDEVKSTAEAYVAHFDRPAEESIADRYATITSQYYDLVTDFYEFGWGKAFHFANRREGEAFDVALARHEAYLSDHLGLRRGMRVVDLGCGVGGPMRHIARVSGANVTGVNISGYQVEKARKYNKRDRLEGQCDILKADFLNIPVQEGTFDAAYAIEATCHAPDKLSIYGEAARVLKPGGGFAFYEWCMTPKFDPNDAEHARLKLLIERGNGIAHLASFEDVTSALDQVGFDVLAARDLADGSYPGIPWHADLDVDSTKSSGPFSLRALPRTPIGRAVTNVATGLLEKVGIAPKGTRLVSSFLNDGADALVKGGKLGIFTPMYFVHAKKR
ncbi:MAG: methyltransferase domain-containing protein [Polyangiaceae bacterium]|nr:methyltransferase domain-containing protein [Polyangiaceae bacterium]